MNIPFRIGQEYKYRELADSVGSKATQGGIIIKPVSDQSDAGIGFMIVTSGGRHGAAAKYHDERKTDGSWVYYGQKKIRSRGNSLLVEANLTVLLFTTREPTAAEVRSRGGYSKLYQYQGPFLVESHNIVDDGDGERLCFKLVSAKNLISPSLEDSFLGRLKEKNITTLRSKLLGYQGRKKKKTKLSESEYMLRSREVKQYALLRAKGKCESCSKPGPFFTKERGPFLEVHHIHRLADDGPDAIENVAALCPNCHREAHFGSSVQKYRDNLSRIIFQKEKRYND